MLNAEYAFPSAFRIFFDTIASPSNAVISAAAAVASAEPGELLMIALNAA
jgi:hypothetical protein